MDRRKMRKLSAVQVQNPFLFATKHRSSKQQGEPKQERVKVRSFQTWPAKSGQFAKFNVEGVQIFGSKRLMHFKFQKYVEFRSFVCKTENQLGEFENFCFALCNERIDFFNEKCMGSLSKIEIIRTCFKWTLFIVKMTKIQYCK